LWFVVSKRLRKGVTASFEECPGNGTSVFPFTDAGNRVTW
jgi:hypothetical protein